MAMTGSSTPSWQVDIPGLSQLILNVGSHGLKQLAMAGVDIHSIGCMLMIAEFTPATQEFRKKIVNARQAQRSERHWLYKAVEIGAATNFLADQLLKTRAGENVVALMTATVPFMNEEMCTAVLSALFEGAKVSLDNIPGLNQLRAIRTGLAPLARKVGFGEKVLHYHQFLCSLDGNHGVLPPNGSPYSAIPSATDIASIMRMLHKIVTCEDPYVLICRGLRGAAWIIAYSSDVLGLRVCALRSDKTSVPITGAYKDCQVLIDLASEQSKCSLYLNKDLQEQIQLQAMRPDQQGWSVDLGLVHFLEYHHPGITRSESLADLSVITALETLNRVYKLATDVSKWAVERPWRNDKTGPGFIGYAESELPQIQARSLRILRQLGLLPGDLEDYTFSTWEGCPNYIPTGHKLKFQGLYGDDPERLKMLSEGYWVGAPPVPEMTVDRIRRYLSESQTDTGVLVSVPEPVHATSNVGYDKKFSHWPEDLQHAFIRTVHSASRFASILAFTDWDISLRRMSVDFLESGRLPDANPLFEGYMSVAMELCVDNLDMATLGTRTYRADWCCLDLDGIVVWRNALRFHSVHEIRGRFLGFTPGRIIFDGQTCSQVRSDFNTAMLNTRWAKEVDESDIKNCYPRLEFPELSIRTLLSTEKDTLYVRHEVAKGLEVVSGIDASQIARNLPSVLIALPCPHGSYSLDPRVSSLGHSLRRIGVVVTEGVFFGAQSHIDTHRLEGINVHYQLVDNSPLGQWLACQWFVMNSEFMIVFQKDCCFDCLLQRLCHIHDKINERRKLSLNSTFQSSVIGLYVCVIAGGVQEQHLEVQPRPALSSSSDAPTVASAPE